MSFLYFIAIVVVVWIFAKSLQERAEKKEAEKPENRVEELEEEAEYGKERALSDKHHIIKLDEHIGLWFERAIDRMEHWYIRLSEKDKHSTEKRLQHAEDWCDYLDNLNTYRDGRDMLDVSSDEQSSNDYYDSASKALTKNTEIEKRFAEQLGEDYEKIMEREEKLQEKEDKIRWEEIKANLKIKKNKK